MAVSRPTGGRNSFSAPFRTGMQISAKQASLMPDKGTCRTYFSPQTLFDCARSFRFSGCRSSRPASCRLPKASESTFHLQTFTTTWPPLKAVLRPFSRPQGHNKSESQKQTSCDSDHDAHEHKKSPTPQKKTTGSKASRKEVTFPPDCSAHPEQLSSPRSWKPPD